jgi:hypothetical protein
MISLIGSVTEVEWAGREERQIYVCKLAETQRDGEGEGRTGRSMILNARLPKRRVGNVVRHAQCALRVQRVGSEYMLDIHERQDASVVVHWRRKTWTGEETRHCTRVTVVPCECMRCFTPQPGSICCISEGLGSSLRSDVVVPKPGVYRRQCT